MSNQKGGDTISTQNEHNPRQWKTRKPYYATYADHMLEFYMRRRKYNEQNPGVIDMEKFADESDRLNWLACDKVYQTLTEQEREILRLIHCTDYDAVEDAVRRYADRTGQLVIVVWRQEHSIQKRVAIERGLIPRKERR